MPKAAGFRHCKPDRFDLAWHCFAPCRRMLGNGKGHHFVQVLFRFFGRVEPLVLNKSA